MIDLEKLVRPNILKLKPYTSARSQHINGLLLDANENAFGSVIDNDDLELNRYPDPTQLKLRQSIGGYLKINPDNIFCGVGSDEIIDLLIRIFCEPGKDKAAIFEPTYGMYKVVCNIQDVETIIYELDNDFQINVEQFLKQELESIKIIFICSPNNPTANIINKIDIIRLSENFNGIVVIDQAYIDFYDERELLDEISKHSNIVLLRTFSKAWGLAGARFGFAVSDSFIVKLLMNIKSPYNINKLTENIVLRSLNKIDHKNDILEKIKIERDYLTEELKSIKGIINVYPSDANYILFKVSKADKVHEKLIEKGIIIRNRSNQLNLEGCLRVTVGTREQNQKFIQELRVVL
ncbi:MAG: histidinol-phosphate transaminase [Melioribacteraceae bacterium]|nr:MAG: histidinol-phosphate transaminase [Melioribacteraceae bacterium]